MLENYKQLASVHMNPFDLESTLIIMINVNFRLQDIKTQVEHLIWRCYRGKEYAHQLVNRLWDICIVNRFFCAFFREHSKFQIFKTGTY